MTRRRPAATAYVASSDNSLSFTPLSDAPHIQRFKASTLRLLPSLPHKPFLLHGQVPSQDAPGRTGTDFIQGVIPSGPEVAAEKKSVCLQHGTLYREEFDCIYAIRGVQMQPRYSHGIPYPPGPRSIMIGKGSQICSGFFEGDLSLRGNCRRRCRAVVMQR